MVYSVVTMNVWLTVCRGYGTWGVCARGGADGAVPAERGRGGRDRPAQPVCRGGLLLPHVDRRGRGDGGRWYVTHN